MENLKKQMIVIMMVGVTIAVSYYFIVNLIVDTTQIVDTNTMMNNLYISSQ